MWGAYFCHVCRLIKQVKSNNDNHNETVVPEKENTILIQNEQESNQKVLLCNQSFATLQEVDHENELQSTLGKYYYHKIHSKI